MESPSFPDVPLNFEDLSFQSGMDDGSSNSQSPNSILVLKNLPFILKQDRLRDILSDFGVAPPSVSYHYDINGAFRGMAFVRFSTLEDAKVVFSRLAQFKIGNRPVKVEFKKISHGHELGTQQGNELKHNKESIPTVPLPKPEILKKPCLAQLWDALINYKNDATLTEEFPINVSALNTPTPFNPVEQYQLFESIALLGLKHYVATLPDFSRHIIVYKNDSIRPMLPNFPTTPYPFSLPVHLTTNTQPLSPTPNLNLNFPRGGAGPVSAVPSFPGNYPQYGASMPTRHPHTFFSPQRKLSTGHPNEKMRASSLTSPGSLNPNRHRFNSLKNTLPKDQISGNKVIRQPHVPESLEKSGFSIDYQKSRTIRQSSVHIHP